MNTWHAGQNRPQTAANFLSFMVFPYNSNY
jgi:hypothetical protein